MKIVITATIESVSQARNLLDVGVDILYLGESKFGLRIKHSFTREEMREVVVLAHRAGARVVIAVNALMHTDEMKSIFEYLKFLEEIAADFVAVADAGVIYKLQKEQINLPYIYDSSIFVTNAEQVNFWAKRGSVGAVLARELPKSELYAMRRNFLIPTEILVYGATVIQHSKRNLLDNYFQFLGVDEEKNLERGWFLTESQNSSSRYSIFEDDQGTHIFANNDLNLLLELETLSSWGYRQWKLEGLYTAGDDFVEIAKIFMEVKFMLEEDRWDLARIALLNERIRQLHPKNRGLDTGFFSLNSEEIQ
ncbi:MAG: U32 family peptidase [Lactobacillales bacterium]|jgi:collagenase-like PrtC family protease|nr:U32 family peptidase [Lactobacillales bacterium]